MQKDISLFTGPVGLKLAYADRTVLSADISLDVIYASANRLRDLPSKATTQKGEIKRYLLSAPRLRKSIQLRRASYGKPKTATATKKKEKIRVRCTADNGQSSGRDMETSG